MKVSQDEIDLAFLAARESVLRSVAAKGVAPSQPEKSIMEAGIWAGMTEMLKVARSKES